MRKLVSFLGEGDGGRFSKYRQQMGVVSIENLKQ